MALVEAVKKTCNTCKVDKDLQEFSLANNRAKYNRRGSCKACENSKYRARYADPSDTFKVRSVTTKLTHDYNMPREIAKKLAENRHGVCKICNTVQYLVVDHCHKTDVFRDIICQACNVMLGVAKDDPKILQSAIEYLKEHA